MNIDFLNDFFVKCSDCGSVNTVDKDSLDTESSSYERNMGPEIEHVFSGEMSCVKCKKDFWYAIKVYEYPEGSLNNVYIENEGCTFIEEPKVIVKSDEYDQDFNL